MSYIALVIAIIVYEIFIRHLNDVQVAIGAWLSDKVNCENIVWTSCNIAIP